MLHKNKACPGLFFGGQFALSLPGFGQPGLLAPVVLDQLHLQVAAWQARLLVLHRRQGGVPVGVCQQHLV